MRLPEAVRSGVESALEEALGRSGHVEDVSPVGGGCISPTARLSTEAGDLFFLKWGAPELPDALLPAEARGLRQLAEAGGPRVPAVIALGAPPGPAWLLLEWLEPGSASPDSWSRLGSELAELHRWRGSRFGAAEANFIGSLPQDNESSDDWPAFWRDRRLEPQLRLALAAGLLAEEDRRRFDGLYDQLPDLLAPSLDDGPSLLHGDLWSGNVHMLAGGTPAVVDPSAYHGHREVDLAMTELFGGFGGGFQAAYRESWPLAPGYTPRRRAVYQLYYLLVHVNLFGSGYVSGTRRALGEAGA